MRAFVWRTHHLSNLHDHRVLATVAIIVLIVILIVGSLDVTRDHVFQIVIDLAGVLLFVLMEVTSK